MRSVGTLTRADLADTINRKVGLSRAESLDMVENILGRMCEDSWVDADLFEIFVREKVYLRYAQTFLEPSQIDAVDESRIPGLPPAPVAAS